MPNRGNSLAMADDSTRLDVENPGSELGLSPRWYDQALGLGRKRARNAKSSIESVDEASR